MLAAYRQIQQRPEVDWVIPDVRFPNEVEAIKRWGGKAVRIDRPGAKASNDVEGHASETSLDGYDGWDFVLSNDSTLEALGVSTMKMYELLK